MARSLSWTALGLLLSLAGQCDGFAASNLSPGQSSAWAANVGWLNWLPDAATGAQVGEYICAGNIYAANVGWINLGNGSPANGIQYQNNSAADFGVNVDATGSLRGFAYGANVGWINFADTGNPAVDLSTGKFSGFAYGANMGWINLGDATFALKVDFIPMGTDSDGDGIPDAWELSYAGNLTTFNGTSDSDQDGQTDLEEFLAGTNPLDPNDSLRIVEFSFADAKASVTWTSKPTRAYRLELRSSLSTTNQWLDSGLGLQPPSGAITTRVLPAGLSSGFLRVEAVRPLSPAAP